MAYFRYNDLTIRVQQLADTQAVLLSRYAAKNPDTWQFKSEHIITNLKGIRPEESRTVVESKGQPVVEIGEVPTGLVIQRAQNFKIFGQPAGLVRVALSVGNLPLFTLMALLAGGTLSGLLLWLLKYQVITPLTHANRSRRLGEQRLTDLVELSSDWFWEQDADYRFTLNSHEYVGGIVSGTLYGKRHWDLPINLSEAQWLAHRADLDARRTFSLRYDIQTMTGKRWIQIHGKPVFDDAGRFTGYRGVGTDITDEINRENELIEHRNHLEQLVTERTQELSRALSLIGATLESTDNGILVVDLQGHITLANDQLSQMWGIPQAMIDAGDFSVVLNNMAAQLKDSCLPQDKAQTVTENPEAITHATTMLTDGRVFSCYSHPQRLGSEVVGRVWSFRDITETHLLMGELEQARALAQQSNEAKSSFLANMSHEIRTPMNAIIGMADLALNTQLTERQRNYLDKIKSASDALLRLINDILDFSKIEAGKLDMEAIPFVLETVFEQLSSIVALRAEKQGIELSYDIGDDTHLLVGDPLRLGQVLTNLVNNALKFSDGGSVVVRVQPDSVLDQSVVLHFSVSDQGIGISAAQLPSLFQPFIQADASTTRRYGGTGLGLAICRHLVEQMNGHLWAESTPGTGSTFHFTVQLPTRGPDRRMGIADVARRLGDASQRPVLVVDDNPITLTVVQHLIGQHGLRVDTAISATAALALLDASPAPDYLACFIDWRMPDVDGLQTIRLLRQTLRARGAPVPPMILITAFSHHEELNEVSGEIDGLVAKPVHASHLYIELARCLGIGGPMPMNKNRRKLNPLEWSRFHGLDILLVEDVEVNREVISELLGAVGLPIRMAVNGELALVAVAEKIPDLILMDCQMPVMDGYAATRKLRENPATEALPIIALTANALASDQEKCFAAGMNAHVAKPIRMEALFERMLQCLPNRQTLPLPLNQEAAPAPVPEDEVLPALPGIDQVLGLALVGGRPKLYRRVLKQFRDNLGSRFADDYAAAEAAGEWETRTRLAHSMKGVAHTLGALTLAESAMTLLHACEAHDAVQCQSLLLEVTAHLQEVMAGLSTLDATTPLPTEAGTIPTE